MLLKELVKILNEEIEKYPEIAEKEVVLVVPSSQNSLPIDDLREVNDKIWFITHQEV